MSSFEVKGREVEIVAHENADALEIARIKGTDYQAVVRKGDFSTGDVAVYIPESAIVPEPIIAELGLEGALAGGSPGPDGKKLKNRVKAIRLRGVLSQGLIYRPADGRQIVAGRDYAEELGIIKYEPPIPLEMAGEIEPCPELLGYTDIENIKRFPNVLAEGEEVVVTEKLHGTCTVFALLDDELRASSKGRSSQGLALRSDDTGEGPRNVYWRIAGEYQIEERLRRIAARLDVETLHLYGETIGVQDLMYGLRKGELAFRAFDLRAGHSFLDHDEFCALADAAGIPYVPVLFRGHYSRQRVEELARGEETLTYNCFNGGAHMREGVVVRPLHERIDPELGRVIVKVISPDYLLRKGNTTEME